MKALDQKLLRDLLHLRGQILAIALVVACGIASFVAMASTYDSLKLSQATYYDRYRFAQVFVHLKRAPDSLLPKIQAIPGVAQVQARVVMDVTVDVPGLKEPATGRLIAIPDRPMPMLNDLYLRQGRYLQPDRPDEVLASEAFVKANRLKLGDSLGAVINGRWQKLRIVGIALSPEYVYEIRGAGDILPDNQHFGAIWMGREALGTAFNLDGAFNDLSVSLAPKAIAADVIFRLDRLLENYGGLGAYGREDQISHRFLSDELDELQGITAIVPPIFLGIAAFLLNILLSRLVSLQREQIAVLKAFGYSHRQIGLHYLKFVLIVVFLGTFLGTVLGLRFGAAITQLYAKFFQFPSFHYVAGIGLLLAAIGISAIAAGLGAFIAVRQAAMLPPAQAMRPEPPADFRPTFIERLGFQRFLSPVGRMILRNLERKPVQAALSVLGITLAVSLLVGGRYSNDAIERLLTVQFDYVQRQDVAISFNELRPARTRYEVEHLPGVMHAEPFRIVPARLRFEHRSHRTAITGLEPLGQLRPLVDRDLHTVNLPTDGIVLSQKLAEILGIKAGESLSVEILEGDRPTRTLAVAGLVDELIDISAYMDINALHRLMREGNVLSGAFLAVDPLQLDRLYALLKRTPAISGVSVKQFAITRFRQTIGETLGIMTSVLIIFACVIAFGVVYNAAQIALSERSRELATLRIIGFTQAEIAIILLGEQALLTLIAIPFGCMAGYGFAALMSLEFNREVFRLPLIITRGSYAFAAIVVAIAAFVSGWLVRRQLSHLDLVAVLKTRE